jgi:hypothetical protein
MKIIIGYLAHAIRSAREEGAPKKKNDSTDYYVVVFNKKY